MLGGFELEGEVFGFGVPGCDEGDWPESFGLSDALEGFPGGVVEGGWPGFGVVGFALLGGGWPGF